MAFFVCFSLLLRFLIFFFSFFRYISLYLFGSKFYLSDFNIVYLNSDDSSDEDSDSDSGSNESVAYGHLSTEEKLKRIKEDSDLIEKAKKDDREAKIKLQDRYSEQLSERKHTPSEGEEQSTQGQELSFSDFLEKVVREVSQRQDREKNLEEKRRIDRASRGAKTFYGDRHLRSEDSTRGDIHDEYLKKKRKYKDDDDDDSKRNGPGPSGQGPSGPGPSGPSPSDPSNGNSSSEQSGNTSIMPSPGLPG